MATGSPRAVVVHGLTGSPSSVQDLAGALAEAGFEVRVPVLPGHRTSPEDLATKGWDDWLGCVREEYRQASADGEPVLLVGLSMGASLVCRVAADGDAPGGGPAGLVLVNPFVDPPAESFRQILRAMLDEGITEAPGIGGDVADGPGEDDGYDRLPIRPLLSLCEGLDDLLPRLGSITCPVLLFTSAVDHVVPPVSSDVLAGRVIGPVERVRLEHSFHVATLDRDRAEIERRAVAFGRALVAGRLRSGAVAEPLGRDEVLHVAGLARLALSDEEVDLYARQLGAVLGHAADIAALDTEGVPPTAHPLPLGNVFRDDVVTPGVDRQEVLAQAPDAEGGLFRVPPVLGQGL